MLCPKCGASSRVLATREGPNLTINRRRQCDAVAGHRFTTVEMHGAAASQAPTRKTAASAAARIALWARDIEIAGSLYEGGEVLGARYGLKIASVYKAASRGRAAIKALGGLR